MYLGDRWEHLFHRGDLRLRAFGQVPLAPGEQSLEILPESLGYLSPPMERFRLDKWLWAARFYKTRALAAEDIAKGRLSVNDQVAKAGREPAAPAT